MFSLIDSVVAGGWLFFFVYRIVELRSRKIRLKRARLNLSLVNKSLTSDNWITLWKEFDTARYGFYDKEKTLRNTAITVWIFYVGLSLLLKVFYYVATH